MGEVVSFVRPGPRWIAPGSCPGGLVVRVYSVPSCALLLERCLASTDDCERLAEDDAAFVDAVNSTREVCLVAWDGDTGARLSSAGVGDTPPGSVVHPPRGSA